jgi:macrodomain Ter protein organizer (MatP/YcbG family)
MTKEKAPRTLKEFVLRHITGEQAAKLHKLLDLSKVKLTRRFNYPQEATLKEVLDLAAFIKQSPFTLIQEYKMGRDNITLSDMEDREELQEGFVYMQEIDDEQAA